MLLLIPMLLNYFPIIHKEHQYFQSMLKRITLLDYFIVKYYSYLLEFVINNKYQVQMICYIGSSFKNIHNRSSNELKKFI